MLSAIWKIAALSGVVGVGCFVVLEVHKRLPEQTGNAVGVEDFQSLDGADAGGQDDALQFAESSDAPAGAVADDASYADPFGAGAQYEQYEPADETAAAQGADNWLLAQDEPGAPEAADHVSPRTEDFSAGDWENADVDGATPRELPQEFTDLADSGDPFAAAGADPSAARQPLTTDTAGPGLAAPEDFDSRVMTADAHGTDEGAVVPASNEAPAGASIAFDPFGGAEESAGAEESIENDPQTESAAEPAPFDLFGGEPAAAEISPEAVMPADFDNAGLSETTPQPRLPAVEQDPFSGVPAETELPEIDATGQPDPFNPFGGNTGLDEPAQPEQDPAIGIDFADDPTAGPDSVLPRDEPNDPTFADSPATLGDPSPHPFVIDEDDGPPAMRTASPAVDFSVEPDINIPGTRSARPDYVGDAILDADVPAGPQQPELTVEKVAPSEATVGEPLIYAIRVKNVGSSAAHDVIVEDRIPRGTTLEGTIPQAELSDKRLVWRLGTIEPDQEQTIRIKVVPTDSGEIGSVATVRFVAEVAATTRITTPALSLDMSGPQEIAIGEQATFRFTVTNNGESDARNVFVRNLLPAGLEHPGGDDIEYEVGTLPAGESRSVELTVTGVEAGPCQTKGLVSTGSTTRSEAVVDVNVIGSRLLIQRQGPKRRFVGSTAEYVTHVSNPSSETLQQITITEQVPEGLELAGVPEGGQYDAQRRTITRQIAELAPGAAMTFQTNLMARDQGTWNGVVRAADAAGNKASVTTPLEVAGFPSLAFDLEHAGRPVAVGERVALRLVVRNRGTGAAEDVQALFEIPDNLTFVNAEGPVSFEQEGRFVRFASLDAIEAEGEESFDIVLTAAGPGTTRVSAQLLTPEMSEPLRHDEAVVVETDGP